MRLSNIQQKVLQKLHVGHKLQARRTAISHQWVCKTTDGFPVPQRTWDALWFNDWLIPVGRPGQKARTWKISQKGRKDLMGYLHQPSAA